MNCKDCKCEEKIKFKDLSILLKIAIVVALIEGGIYLLIFIEGFIKGFLGL